MASSGEKPEPLFHVVLHEPEIPNNTGNIGRTCIATHCALHLIRPLGFDTSEKACRRAGLDYWPRLRPTEHESFEAYVRWCASTVRLDSLARCDTASTLPEPMQRTSAGGAAPCNPQEEIRLGLIEGVRGIHPPHQYQRHEIASLNANPGGVMPANTARESGSPPRLWLFTTKPHAGRQENTRSVPVFDADLRAGDHLVFGKETRGLPDELLERYADRLVTLPMAAGERSLNLATAVCAAVYEGLRQLRARGEISFSAEENRIVTG